MRFFDFLKGPDINQGVKEYSTTDGAVLLDVRTPDEYRQGHIPGSKNVPLQSIDKVAGMIDNKATPIFVHCLSGARSRQAAAVLQQLGYTNVKNIGGISAYAGKVDSCCFAAAGLYQREKHRRNFRLCRKGGAII